MKLRILLFTPVLAILFVIGASVNRQAPLAFSAPKQKTGTVSANGLTFNYCEEGSGPPVVLVHGSVSDYREWARQMAPLGRHHRVIAYSRRYHWPNAAPGPNADASLEAQTNDLAAILRAMNIDKAHLVGHSYGGAVALQLALRHPEQVRTLVLAEPGVAGVLGSAPEDEAARKEGQETRTRMKEAFASGDDERIVRTYAAHVAPGVFEKASPETKQMLLANAAAFELDYNAKRLPFTCDSAQRITVPVLLLSGDRSPAGLQRITETTARCIKGARLAKIPQATHWLPHDQPKAFNEAVLTFLKRNNQ